MTDWGEIGKGDHPAQNPPQIGRGDLLALRWYNENATGFIKDYGLLPMLLSELGMKPGNRSLFLTKASHIHRAMMDIGQKEAEEKSKHGRH